MGFIRRFALNIQATALLEFAIVFPVLFVLIIGTIELSRLSIIKGRVDRMAYVLGDIVSRYPEATNPATAGQLNEQALGSIMTQRFDRMLQPYDSHARRMIIVTSIQNKLNPAGTAYEKYILWQHYSGGYRMNEVKSVVNDAAPPAYVGTDYADTNLLATGSVATFPSAPRIRNLLETSMLPDENFIVVETSYRYSPLFFDLLGAFGITSLSEGEIKSVSYLRPRNTNGYLRYLPGSVPAP